MNYDDQEGPDIGAFLLTPVRHFFSGAPLQNLSGVDITILGKNSQPTPRASKPSDHELGPKRSFLRAVGIRSASNTLNLSLVELIGRSLRIELLPPCFPVFRTLPGRVDGLIKV